MATEVKLPQYGMTMHEATLLSWLKEVGDPVEEGEPLVEFDTDKMVVDVPSPAAGVLAAIEARPGDVVAVLARIAVIE